MHLRNKMIKQFIKGVIPHCRVELGKHTCEKTPPRFPKIKIMKIKQTKQHTKFPFSVTQPQSK